MKNKIKRLDWSILGADKYLTGTFEFPVYLKKYWFNNSVWRDSFSYSGIRKVPIKFKTGEEIYEGEFSVADFPITWKKESGYVILEAKGNSIHHTQEIYCTLYGKKRYNAQVKEGEFIAHSNGWYYGKNKNWDAIHKFHEERLGGLLVHQYVEKLWENNISKK